MSSIVTIGANGKGERQKEDFYATEPKATELLMELETFSQNILEGSCGKGHISEVLKRYGYNVLSSDIIDRGYGEIKDFFDYQSFKGDIIMNPPFKLAKEFLEHSMEIVENGSKIALFLKLTFLEGKERKKMFKKYPPKTVYVSSSRLECAKNGDFEKYKGSAMCFCWYIWEKGYKGDTIVKWFN